jgi:excisionase family DNA binding protein
VLSLYFNLGGERSVKRKLKVKSQKSNDKTEKVKVVYTPQTMTVMQVAASLQISRSTAYSLVRSNGFPKIMIRKRLLVPCKAFEEWMIDNTKLSYRDYE